MDENTNPTLVAADQKDGLQTFEGTPEPVKVEPTKPKEADSEELAKLKRLLSKANSEAAAYKEQLRAKQTEAERAAAERAEQEQAMREELEALRKEKDDGDTINRSLALNIEPDVARKMAEAWGNRDKASMFDCIKAIIEATTTRIQNESLNRQPSLSAGIPPTKSGTDDELDMKLRKYAGLGVRR